jgi:hypothetical protein
MQEGGKADGKKGDSRTLLQKMKHFGTCSSDTREARKGAMPSNKLYWKSVIMA